MSGETGMKQNDPKIIGITGGVGSGKSEVVKIFADKFNAYPIIADHIARRLSEKGHVSYELIIKKFGRSILSKNGEIDRSKLADAVFGNNRLLNQLNAYIHPHVKEAILKEVSDVKKTGGYDYIVIEAALLVDGGFQDICDELWYVFSDEYIRRERLRALRNYSEGKINSIMNNQLSESAYENACDRIIINNTNIDDVFWQIKKILN